MDQRFRNRDRRIGRNPAKRDPKLWALLHFREQSEQLHRREAQHALKELLPRYDKRLDFHRMRAGYEQAVGRAADLQKKAEEAGTPKRNPTTTVYRLTERIKTGG